MTNIYEERLVYLCLDANSEDLAVNHTYRNLRHWNIDEEDLETFK